MRLGRRWHFGEPFDRKTWWSKVADNDGVAGQGFFQELREIFGNIDIRKADGLLSSLGELEGEDFSPKLVDPQVRALYERTSSFGFLAQRLDWTWHGWLLHWLWHSAAGGMQQLLIPVKSGFLPREMASDIREASSKGVTFRGWVRTFEPTNRVLYAAVVTTFRPESAGKSSGHAYFVMCVPVFKGNLTLVFRPSHHRGGGLRLDTHVPGDTVAGAYIVFPGPGCRRYTMAPALTMWDEIRVWPELSLHGHPVLLATHRSSLFGMRAFELHYVIRPRSMAP